MDTMDTFITGVIVARQARKDMDFLAFPLEGTSELSDV
jgi:hypothetical protein